MVVVALPADEELVPRLRAGDGAAFRAVVACFHSMMVRVAETYVPSRAVAEEVVQDTWIAVMRGLGGFEGRSSLKTWMFRILANQARTRGERERRTVPMSSLASELDDEPSVPPERFKGPAGRGHWAQPPARWSDQPEARLLSGATFELVTKTVERLPENQRRVLVLRDIEGWSSEEVRDLLELSDVNQRVLLHRARSRVRAALEEEMGGHP
ncbi:MAG TPA: sigma-70 family RNA polymerase sigma factor [Acidimicrobiales bacterium]|nr:sigma-70 family RNA polymerase sigma factor [Acidimicrobiales bacterium]